MTFLKSIAALAAVAILTACQTTEQETATPTLSSTDMAALKQKWEGHWSGTWGGTCTGAIDVSNVSAGRASVTYSWGHCGNAAPGSTKDSRASIDGDKLTVHLRGRTEAGYSHVDENTLQGNYQRPSDGATGEGLFKRGS